MIAQVGDVETSGVVGGLEIKEVNETRELVLEMCVQKEATACNTPFRNRDIHKTKWVRRVREKILVSQVMDYFCLSHQVIEDYRGCC